MWQRTVDESLSSTKKERKSVLGKYLVDRKKKKVYDLNDSFYFMHIVLNYSCQNFKNVSGISEKKKEKSIMDQ